MCQVAFQALDEYGLYLHFTITFEVKTPFHTRKIRAERLSKLPEIILRVQKGRNRKSQSDLSDENPSTLGPPTLTRGGAFPQPNLLQASIPEASTALSRPLVSRRTTHCLWSPSPWGPGSRPSYRWLRVLTVYQIHRVQVICCPSQVDQCLNKVKMIMIPGNYAGISGIAGMRGRSGWRYF